MKNLIRLFNYSALIVILSLCFATTAKAVDLDFDLVNETGYTINQVFVSPAKSDDWQENILKGKLRDGETLEISFPDDVSVKKWDLKINWADNSGSVYWRSLDLSKINKLTLYYNEKTEETSAKAE